MKVKLIIISIILLLVMVFASGCIPIMENIGMISPTNEEQLSPEKGGPPDGLVKVLIGFKEKPGAAQQAMVKGVGGKIKYTYHIVDAIAASIPEKAIVALQKNPNVTHVDLDGEIFTIGETLPWGVDRIDAEVVHSTNKGYGAKVAILDTGIDLDHPDLIVVGGENFSPGKSYDDKNGHGTHVAGIIAALDNEIGIIGVAPEANLYAVKVLNNSGSGWWSDLIAGLQWCVDEGMDVANMSLGATSAPLDVLYACDAADNAGLLLVAAAGNEYGGSVIYPAKYDSIIAVSATNSADGLAYFSSTGNEVELAAPGVDIYSTYKGGGYVTMSGTSMACPHVVGVAALVIAAAEISDVRTQLQDTAEDLGAEGRDSQFGNGLADAENAVLGSTNGNNLPPTATGTISGTVTDFDTEEPIEGAQVTADGYSDFTKADGTYTLADVAEGTYTVTASADGYESASKDVTVIENDTSTVDFALSPLSETGTMYVESIGFSSKVAGPNKFLYTTVKVVDGDGIALEGIRVEMTLDWDKEGDGTIDDSWNFAGDTDVDGMVKFTQKKAPSGYYTATVTNLKGVLEASCELEDDGTVIQ